MKTRTCWALLVTMLLVGAAWADVITDYDRHANFSNYKTYSWGKVDAANSIWESRMKDAVASQLAAIGWKEVESGGDVVVNVLGITRLGQDVHVSASGSGDGFRGPWGGMGFGDANGSKSTYAIGTLIVEMADANSKKMVWWGLSDRALPTKSEKAAKNLDKDVEKMFKKFPGSNKK